MFCPKCATQNVEGASYCRTCGANVSLVPQAINGQLPVANQPDDCYAYSGRRTPSMERAVRSLTMGVAFAVMVALTSTYAPGRTHWWFWLIVPAMLMFSRGFFELVRLHGARNRLPAEQQKGLRTAPARDLPSMKTGELINAVPSVTEGTTRHLESEARTRQL